MKRHKQGIRITADGSIVGEDGKILFFSLKRFRRDIVEGNCCFICGISPAKTQFNDEHVIPDWILKEFSLHNKLVTLPNSSGLCGACRIYKSRIESQSHGKFFHVECENGKVFRAI